MHAGSDGRASVVGANEFVGGAVGALLHQGMEQRHVDRGAPALALSKGATVPVSRARCPQRTRIARLIENSAATCWYVSVPVSYGPWPVRATPSDTDWACASEITERFSTQVSSVVNVQTEEPGRRVGTTEEWRGLKKTGDIGEAVVE